MTTLTLELSEEELARAEAHAQAEGLDVSAYLRAFIARLPAPSRGGNAGQGGGRRVLYGLGRYPGNGHVVEDFLREREAEVEEEERKLAQRHDSR